jgi:hypothetical protein
VINSQKVLINTTDEEFWDTNRQKDTTEVSYNRLLGSNTKVASYSIGRFI